METEEHNDQWLSLDDISLLQQSLLDTHNESSILGFPSCGVEDLSCSLIHCNGLDGDIGDGDHPATGTLNDIENFCGEISKRNKIIAALFSTLTTVVKHREDGDSALNSVEKQMKFLHEELERFRRIGIHSVCGAKKDNVSNILTIEDSLKQDQSSQSPDVLLINMETQTARSHQHSDSTVTDDIITPTTVHQSVQCTFELSSNIRQNSIKSLPQAASEIINSDSSPAGFNEFESPMQIGAVETGQNLGNEQHNKSFESDDYNMHSCGSPNLPSMHPSKEMFRLTFSPSICEYEAETHSDCKRSDHDLAVMEDLKLQFIDAERKYEATKRFLEEMTAEREQEREDFQRTINDLVVRCEEIKKEKDKVEATVLKQQLELEDVLENLNESNQIKNEVLQKSMSIEYELKHAVEKICELRDIIRGLEEQVEEATRQATAYSNTRKGISEESVAEEFSKSSCVDVFQQHDDEGASELDITVELQAQVHELAKRIEEKLVELENFSWQTRPGSSCSVKSGDDVSVRAADRVNFNDDNDAPDQDIVSQVFCGLRRLEYSFDTLVRFEEVLIKKIKDADLKISNDNKTLEELTRDNYRLRQDLGLCRQKMLQFENFMSETKKSHSESSTPRPEALRTHAHSISSRFEELSPGVKRPRLRGQMEPEQPRPADDLDELERDGQGAGIEEYEFDKTSNTNDPNNSNPTGGDGNLGNENLLPSEYGSEEFANDTNDYGNIVPVSSTSESPLVGKKNSNGGNSNPSGRGSNNPVAPTGAAGIQESDGGSNSPLNGLVLETTLEDVSGSNPGKSGGNDNSKSNLPPNSKGNNYKSNLPPNTNLSNSESCSGQDQDGSNLPPNSNLSKSESCTGQGQDGSSILKFCTGPNGSRHYLCNNGSNLPSDLNGSNSKSDLPPNSNGSNPDPCTGQGQDGSSILKFCTGPNGSRHYLCNNGGSEIPVSGFGNSGENEPSENPPNFQNNDAVNIQDKGLDTDEDVITYDITTVSDYEVDGENLKYIGSTILPPEDSYKQSDDQLNRLQGVHSIVELEKLKTKLDQLQQALEAEKQKTQDLAQQLNAVLNASQYDIPNSGNSHQNVDQQSRGPDPGPGNDKLNLEDYVDELEQTLDERDQIECRLRKHLECATLAYHQLQEENQELRDHIETLEADLEYYTQLDPEP